MVSPTRYDPATDFFEFDKEVKFYEKNHYRSFEKSHSKIAAKVHPCISIDQGNHYITMNSCNGKDLQPKFFYGNNLGLGMSEFRFRSPEQMHIKYNNGYIANTLGKENGVLGKEIGGHYDSYIYYMQKYYDKAGEVKFNESIV